MKLPAWLSRPATVALSAFCAAVLPACDGANLQALHPGQSTRAEVEARMGKPLAEFANDDGTTTWEYNRQPNGVECHMLTFDSQGVLVRIEQVLNEANFASIQAGMTQDQVRRRLGKPATVTTFERQGEVVWDWRVAGTLPTEEAHFHVHFDQASGLVKKTSRRVEGKG